MGRGAERRAVFTWGVSLYLGCGEEEGACDRRHPAGASELRAQGAIGRRNRMNGEPSRRQEQLVQRPELGGRKRERDGVKKGRSEGRKRDRATWGIERQWMVQSFVSEGS